MTIGIDFDFSSGRFFAPTKTLHQAKAGSAFLSFSWAIKDMDGYGRPYMASG